MWVQDKVTQVSASAGHREGLLEELTFELRLEGWIRAGQASGGRGGRAERERLPSRLRKC